MTTAEYNEKIAKLDKAIASAATPEREKDAMRALKTKLEAKKAELVKDEPAKKPNYDEWEREVTDIIGEKLGAPNGDAQGIVEAQHFYVTQAWGQGLTAAAAAKQILEKSDTKKSAPAKGGSRSEHWKGMSKKAVEEYAEYWGNKKKLWHKKEIGLSKDEVAELKEFQKFIHANYPEFDHYLTSQVGNIKNEDEFAGKFKEHVKESFDPKDKKSEYDCDALIEKERERQKASKASAEARAKAAARPQSVKNRIAIEKVSERVMGNIQKRIDKGEVKRPELEKLIKETEDFLNGLRASLKKL